MYSPSYRSKRNVCVSVCMGERKKIQVDNIVALTYVAVLVAQKENVKERR